MKSPHRIFESVVMSPCLAHPMYTKHTVHTVEHRTSFFFEVVTLRMKLRREPNRVRKSIILCSVRNLLLYTFLSDDYGVTMQKFHITGTFETVTFYFALIVAFSNFKT